MGSDETLQFPNRPANEKSSSSGGQDSDIIIVGIDFGTTYSGVAWTWANKIEQLEVVTSWQSYLPQNADCEKVQTAISHDKSGTVSWGHDIAPTADQVRWFKLLLIDEKDLPEEVRRSNKLTEARNYLRRHNKTAISVIAEYLRLLWDHCEQRIADTISHKFVYKYARFHFVITVPAIWPQYARVRMKEAAKMAGLLDDRLTGTPQLDIISEPEAAALATLRDVGGRSDIKPGDTFVVVDCGGGTADLISYEVTSTSPMVVKECVKGQGGLCGAVFVDEAFASLLMKKFGQEAWGRMSPYSRQRLMQADWEYGIKHAFDGHKTRTWIIDMPPDCFASGERNRDPRVELSAEDVRSVFDPVVNEIKSMVAEQIAAVKARCNKDPKYVFLVGGFGRCRYLFNSLKESVGKSIEILQSRSTGPWTAICRGAVIHAASLRGLGSFTVDVEARIARASYGIDIMVPFDPKIHLYEDRRWNDMYLAYYAYNQIRWVLKAGDTMVTKEPIRFPFNRLYRKTQTTICPERVDLFTSTVSPPPSRINKDVEMLTCSIPCDVQIDATTLPVWTNREGEEFYKFDFYVHLVCVGGTIDFSIHHNGKQLGAVNVVAKCSDA